MGCLDIVHHPKPMYLTNAKHCGGNPELCEHVQMFGHVSLVWVNFNPGYHLKKCYTSIYMYMYSGISDVLIIESAISIKPIIALMTSISICLKRVYHAHVKSVV